MKTNKLTANKNHNGFRVGTVIDRRSSSFNDLFIRDSNEIMSSLKQKYDKVLRKRLLAYTSIILSKEMKI